MPRATRLDSCSTCGGKVQVGVYTAFYVLHHRPQIKDTLKPSRGYCVDCFLKFAKKWGVGQNELRELRHKIRGAAPVIA